jgi:RNA polymerase sigma factor (sigma-70 family)
MKINHKKFAFCLMFALFCQTKLFNVLIKKLNKNLKFMSTLEFNESLIHMQSHLTSFAMGFTRNEEDAKDLTQETMLKAIVYKDYYTAQTNFKAWVFTIMRNLFINQYRRNKKSGTIFDANKEFDMLANTAVHQEDAIDLMTNKEINSKISNLGEEYKVPFNLHFEGFKYKEIADKLEIPIGTVKSRIFIARQKLMEALPEYRYLAN